MDTMRDTLRDTLKVVGFVTAEGEELALQGRFTLLGHGAFRDAFLGALANPACRKIRIDLAGVTQCDWSALPILWRCRDLCLLAHKVFVLSHPSAVVRQALTREVTTRLSALAGRPESGALPRRQAQFDTH